MDQVGNVLHKHDLQIPKFEQYMADTMDQGFSNNVAQDVQKQLQDFQAQIDGLKEPGTAIQAGSEDLCKTVVVGGLIGLPSLPEDRNCIDQKTCWNLHEEFCVSRPHVFQIWP